MGGNAVDDVHVHLSRDEVDDETEAVRAIYGDDVAIKDTPAELVDALALLLLLQQQHGVSDGDASRVRSAVDTVQALVDRTPRPASSSLVDWEAAADAAAATTASVNSPFVWRTISVQCEGGGDVLYQPPSAADGPALLRVTYLTLRSDVASDIATLLAPIVYPNIAPTSIWISTPPVGVTVSPFLRIIASAAAVREVRRLRRVAGAGSGPDAAAPEAPSLVIHQLVSWMTAGRGGSGAADDVAAAIARRSIRTDLVATTDAPVVEGVRLKSGPSLAPTTRSVATTHSSTSVSEQLHRRPRDGGKSSNVRRDDAPRSTPALAAVQARDDAAWSAAAVAAVSNPAWRAMAAARERLPVTAYRAQLCAAIAAHPVVLLSGATGCGKSTQLPQYLLEDAIAAGRGGRTRIIVTQPRRLAAIGVATRVAAERCEPLGVPGGAVGYHIRGDKRAHASTALLFTTTGVLLRRIAGGGLGHVTHIVVDEVHERGVDTDFLLGVLKALLPTRPDVKLVLMSATMDAGEFARYFDALASIPLRRGAMNERDVRSSSGGCPVITVPGLMHPVRDVYIDDVLKSGMLGRFVPRIRGVRQVQHEAAAQPSVGGVVRGGAMPGAADEGEVTIDDLENDDNAENAGASASALASNDRAEALAALLEPGAWRRHGLDYTLAATLILAVASGRGPMPPPAAPGRAPGAGAPSYGTGAILVFLPGAPEIRRLHRMIDRLAAEPVGADAQPLHVLHLHGSLSPEEQAAVFRAPPRGTRKVVLATNVAETSLTIDDVTVVIDTLRVKEAGYDATAQLSRLTEGWTSQASAQQRRGRAGRTCPGVCFRLVPEALYASLAPRAVPEIARVPLESIVLQVKTLRLGANLDQPRGAQLGHRSVAHSVRAFMATLLEPPPRSALDSALGTLREIGALAVSDASALSDEGDTAPLTPLGVHLAALPLDVRLGKALVYGAILGVIDPVLTIVAALADRSPWRPLHLPGMDDSARAAIEARRAELAWAQSDHLTIARAFSSWRASPGGAAGRRAFADAAGLSHEMLRSMSDMRVELAGALADLGFLRRSGGKLVADDENDDEYEGRRDRRDSRGGTGGEGRYGELSPAANACAEQPNVVRAALVAGLWPSVAKVITPPRRYHETASGAVPTDFSAKEVRYYTLAPLRERAPPGGTSRGAGAAQRGREVDGASHKSPPAEFDAAGAAGDDDNDVDGEAVAPEVVDAPTGRPQLVWRGFVQERVWLHPSSVLFSVGEYRCPWIVFHEQVEGSGGGSTQRAGSAPRVFIRDASAVTPYAMLLFGGPLTVDHVAGAVTVGGRRWIRFHAEARLGALLQGLRGALNRLLAEKVEAPALDLRSHSLVDVLIRLLVGNGM